MTLDLFPDEPPRRRPADQAQGSRTDHRAPLAERLRPRNLDEIVGQVALEPGSMLRRALELGRVPSMVLWGPPGCGKTTLALALADQVGQHFVSFSAVLSGVKEVREVVAEAKALRRREGIGTLLFVDEIHRFNKSQQDAFLPHLEDGTLILVGATTENPSFHLNGALLSRCSVVTLEPLSEDALGRLAERALSDEERGLGAHRASLTPEALTALARGSHGDGRSLLNRLETLVTSAVAGGESMPIHEAALERLLSRKLPYHDRAGDAHFQLTSALHKSIRGGDAQATLYYLARLFEGGEDPLYIARRLIRIASEDVGLASPEALPLCVSAMEAYRFLGSPEGDLGLAEAAVFLATSPKSNAVYEGFARARERVRQGSVDPVPLPLRNAPTPLMKQLGYGSGYQYPHDMDDGVADQDYLPERLRGEVFYRPAPFGAEKDIARRMAAWDQIRRGRQAPGDSPS